MNRGLAGFGARRAVICAEYVPLTGTAVAVRGIPAWATEVRVSLLSMVTAGTVVPAIQIGSGAALVTSGYVGAASLTQNGLATSGALISGGFSLSSAWASNITASAQIVLIRQHGATNAWTATSLTAIGGAAPPGTAQMAGYVVLPGAIGQMNLITSDGFTAGTMTVIAAGVGSI